MMYWTLLGKAVDLELLLANRPELFNFGKLRPDELSELMAVNRFNKKHIKPDEFDADVKAFFILKGHYGPEILTENDIESLSDTIYSELLDSNFKKFVRVARLKQLPERDHRKFFAKHPHWFAKNIPRDEFPKITSDMMDTFSEKKSTHDIVELLGFDVCSTDGRFWINMFKHKEEYKEIFIKNTKCVSTKSEVRCVLYKYPEIIKMLDADVIGNSKLTAKEWFLLLATLKRMGSTKGIFDDWDLPQELLDVAKQDLSAEVLTGKSVLTANLKTAIAIVDNSRKEEGTDLQV